MPVCREMKKDEVYFCETCGLEIQVVKECNECSSIMGECTEETCKFICCDKPLSLKE